MSTTSIISIVVLILIVGYVIFLYNRLVGLRQKIQEAWSDIDAQLKRRHDLIPNLVDTVKGYAEHERGTFEEVTKARSQAQQAGTIDEKNQAENMLSDTLKSLFAVAENYPDLKASQNFQELQRELSDTENKILAARRFYNSNVMNYNTFLQTFPTNILGPLFSFQTEEYFEAEAGERENVDVDFGQSSEQSQ
ncbi:MAG: LemA family protein [Candidatus Paceibacteria bacterium]